LNLKRKAVSGILVTLLLMSFLTLIFNIQPVEALTTPLINPVPGQYANYTMYFQNGTAYGSCLTTYQNYDTSILVNVSIEQQIKDNYWDSWYLVNVMNRQQHFISMRNYSREQLEFEDIDVFWSFWIETDIKLDDEITLEGSLSKVVDSGIIDAAGFIREYWLLESDPYMNITFLWGFDKETGILIFLKTFSPVGITNFMLTSTNIFILADAEPKPAEFVLSNFNYTSEIQKGEPLRIYVDIANVGEMPGETTIIIEIDGVTQSDLQSLFQLGPEEVFSQVWTTYQVYGTGTHTIQLDGFEDRFSVIPKPIPFWDNIPGFPYESIILGLIAVIIIIWRARNL